MKHPQFFGLLFHPKFFVTAVFFLRFRTIGRCFCSRSSSLTKSRYTPTNWRPTLACHWRVSCIDLASHSKVHATRSRDRLYNKGRQQLEAKPPRLYGKLGFVWKQVSVLGSFWKSWVLKNKKNFSSHESFPHPFLIMFCVLTGKQEDLVL